MATENQLLKLEKIQAVVTSTPTKKIPYELSRGRLGYKNAIKSVMNVGMWALASAILSTALIVLFLGIKWLTTYNGPRDYEIYLSAFGIIASVTSGILGWKLMTLQGTPIFTLIALLIILVVNVFLVIGVIPFFTVVFDIIALSRYSTFCSWFHGIKP